MTQPNGRKVQYGYNEAGNPIQVIDDAEGLKLQRIQSMKATML